MQDTNSLARHPWIYTVWPQLIIQNGFPLLCYKNVLHQSGLKNHRPANALCILTCSRLNNRLYFSPPWIRNLSLTGNFSVSHSWLSWRWPCPYFRSALSRRCSDMRHKQMFLQESLEMCLQKWAFPVMFPLSPWYLAVPTGQLLVGPQTHWEETFSVSAHWVLRHLSHTIIVTIVNFVHL